MIQLWYSVDEMREFLTRHGFEIRTQKEIFTRSIYHDDTEEYELEFLAVYKDGQEYGRFFGHSPSGIDWLDHVFEQELRKAILAL